MTTSIVSGGLSLGRRNPMRPMFGMPRFYFDTPGEAGGGAGGAGGGNGAGGQGGQGGEGGGNARTITLTQDELNDMIEGRLSKERRKHETTVSDLQRQLDEIKGFNKGGKGGTGKGEGGEGGKVYTQAELEAYIASEYEPKIKTEKERTSKLMDKIKGSEIIAAAAALNAVNPKQVAKLLDAEIDFDDEGELVVRDDKGNVLLGEKGKPLSVAAHVEAFLKANGHLVKGSGTSGAGSSTLGAGGGATAPKTSIDKISAGLSKL